MVTYEATDVVTSYGHGVALDGMSMGGDAGGVVDGAGGTRAARGNRAKVLSAASAR